MLRSFVFFSDFFPAFFPLRTHFEGASPPFLSALLFCCLVWSFGAPCTQRGKPPLSALQTRPLAARMHPSGNALLSPRTFFAPRFRSQQHPDFDSADVIIMTLRQPSKKPPSFSPLTQVFGQPDPALKPFAHAICRNGASPSPTQNRPLSHP